jgi:hypothetical protein
MLPFGENSKGEIVMGICESSEPGEVGTIAAFTKVKSAVPVAPGEELGTLKETDDGHVEFTPVEKDQPVEVEDQSSRKGPSKVASKAYRDGWERIFKN